jgi:hypothetical protein
MSMTASLEGNAARGIQSADETAKRADKSMLETFNSCSSSCSRPISWTYASRAGTASWRSSSPGAAALPHRDVALGARTRVAGKGDLDGAAQELALVEAQRRIRHSRSS